MNLDADMASTIIVLAILLTGALTAIVASRHEPAHDPLRWHS